jgi:GT2 family glycosyltransferase
MGNPRISVVVLTWNGADYIAPCLEALLAQAPPALEVLVVDNGSTDGTPDLVAERFPQVRLLRNERNLGFAAGNNAGLRAASGDLLVLLNQDTQVHPGFLAALARAFDDATVGLAGCKLLYPDGTIQHAGGYFYGPRGETDHLGRLAPDDGRFDELTEPEFVTGAAVAIRRETLAQAGLLDEGFVPAYYEDVDWCFRARAAGWRVVYVPEAVVTHQEGASADRDSYGHILSVNHGRVRFLLKHWSLDRLLHEFGPAEAAWVAAQPRVVWLMAARGAYLQALLDLPGILSFRGSSEAEALALANLLSDLRAAALVSLEALPEAQTLFPQASETPPEPGARAGEETSVQQPPAQPRGLLARLRRLWAGLRYLDVLPDLVGQVQQHGQALAQHGQAQVQQGELIGWVSRRVDGLERRSAEQGEMLAGQARDVAENIRELTVVAEQLARLEVIGHSEQDDG